MKGSKQLVRLYTSRSVFPFSQSSSLQRSTNTSSTFVSSHYKVGLIFVDNKQIDENMIVDYLQRKGWQYKENADEYIVRECMFCPKPHYNKADNLYKLSLSLVSSTVDISVRKRALSYVIVVVPVARGLTSKESREISKKTSRPRC